MRTAKFATLAIMAEESGWPPQLRNCVYGVGAEGIGWCLKEVERHVICLYYCLEREIHNNDTLVGFFLTLVLIFFFACSSFFTLTINVDILNVIYDPMNPTFIFSAQIALLN